MGHFLISTHRTPKRRMLKGGLSKLKWLLCWPILKIFNNNLLQFSIDFFFWKWWDKQKSNFKLIQQISSLPESEILTLVLLRVGFCQIYNPYCLIGGAVWKIFTQIINQCDGSTESNNFAVFLYLLLCLYKIQITPFMYHSFWYARFWILFLNLYQLSASKKKD